MAKLSDLFGRGVLASRPAAGIAGRHYHSTDSTPPTTYRDNGSSWDAEATSGMAAVTTTRGDLIVRGASADGRLAVGAASTGLFSDGTDPSWRKALPADIDVSADNTTGNATTGHHGWLPKGSGVATDYLDGTLAWSTPAGSGGGGGSGSGIAVFSGVRVVRTTAQSISNATLTAILWDSEDYDTDAYHSTVSNTSRLVAPSTGKYLIEATVSTASAAGGNQRYVDLYKNGTTVIGADNWPFVATNTQGAVHTVVSLTAGDYVEVRVYQDSGGAVNLSEAAGTHATMTLIGGTPSVALFAGVKVYASAGQSLTDVAIPFDSEEFDTDGYHSTSSNTTRITIPSGKAGKYLLQAGTFCSGTTRLEFHINGSANAVRTTGGSISAAGYTELTGIADLAAGDYVEVVGNAGAARTYGDNSEVGAKSSFAAVLLGGAAVTSIAPTAHGARVTRSANQSVGNNTLTAIAFTAEDFDTDAIHDTVTNNTRLTIPAITGVVTGLWGVKASAYADLAGIDLQLKVNGTTAIAFVRTDNGAIGSAAISADWVFTAGDYVELYVRTAAGAGNAAFDAGVSPVFSIAFLGKVT